MDTKRFEQLNLKKVETPVYIVDETYLERNLKILKSVKDRTDCKILLALKGFAMHSTFPQVRKYLDGICASSPHEARLGKEKFGKEVHTYGPAYSEKDIADLLKYSDTIVFNSFSQWNKYKSRVQGKVETGLRVNPGYAEVENPLYNPCTLNSRLGIPYKNFVGKSLEGIDGLHFHAMCEQNSDVLERILRRFEEKFSRYFTEMKWINFGGGHHITRPDYDVDLLCKLVNDFKEEYGVQVYLEPGEAIALHTGVLVASVQDIMNNGMDIAILDTSAETHMPDVLAMPYRPGIIGAGKPRQYKYTYRLGGQTCLAGDVIGDYSFKKKLKQGDKLVFLDMAHYTMVKTTTFNGVKLPDIALNRKKGGLKVVRKFGYSDYKNRLS
jgi:carboxynorspermidine decarboxylase